MKIVIQRVKHASVTGNLQLYKILQANNSHKFQSV